VGQVKPGTLQLATSPSTSDMQDRVLQAVAKHGPLASELVEDDESEAEVDVQTSPEVSSEISPETSPETTPETSPETSPASLSTAEVGPGDSLPPTASE
jgi:hypothetical protein